MGKNFLTLYILLGLAIAGSIIGIEMLPEYFLQGKINTYKDRISQGTFFLIFNELNSVPTSGWEHKLTKLRPFFGYPLFIESLEAVDLPETKLQRLAQGHAEFSNVDGAEYWFKQIDDFPYVLVAGMGQTKSEDTKRLAQGTFYLLKKQFKIRDQRAWPKTLSRLQQQFGFPISIVLATQTGLKQTQKNELAAGELVSTDSETSGLNFYQSISETPYVLRAGPIVDDVTPKHLDLYLILAFAVVVGLAIYSWMRPVWRDIRRLTIVAGAFGRGEFGARNRLPRRSPVWRLASTFDSMADRIRNLLESHKSLTHAVSHELRTPIARLRFGLEMLENSGDSTTSERYIRGMHVDIGELDHLVTELLTYARFDREKPALEIEASYIAPWLQDSILRICQYDTNIKPVLSVGSAPSTLEASFDKKLMERALGNLVGNACRYANSRVEVEYGSTGDGIFFDVCDDGPGVPMAERGRIFEPFARLDSSRDRQSGGVGLGLAIVKQIAHWHRGTVSIGDASLGGARFRVTWPQGC